MKRGFISAILLAFGTAILSGTAGADAARVRCDKNTEITFEDWQDWTRITPEPKPSPGHSGAWVGIYTNDLATKTYLNASSPYRTCAAIVKPVYSDATGNKVFRMTIMVKMQAGYDPENGDWWYGKADKTGTRIRSSGKIRECIACHKQAAETDYLFSKDVMNDLRK